MDQDVDMSLAIYGQKVKISLGKLCKFVLDLEDVIFSIQMEIFKLFNRKYIYRS